MQLNTHMFTRYQQSKLPSNFWAYTQELAESEKLLLIYLYSSPFTNRLGCFQFNIKDLEVATGYGEEKVYCDLSFLGFDGYVKFYNNWIFLPHYLVYFPIRNPNQGKHIETLFHAVPSKCSFYFDLVHQLLLVNHLSRSFRKYLKCKLYCLVQKRIDKDKR